MRVKKRGRKTQRALAKTGLDKKRDERKRVKGLFRTKYLSQAGKIMLGHRGCYFSAAHALWIRLHASFSSSVEVA